MRKFALLVAVMAVAVLPATGAMAQTSDGQVIVVHGVPDLEVDVYVNGDLTLEGFQFGDVAGPLALPEGTYDVEIYAAGADRRSGGDDCRLSAGRRRPDSGSVRREQLGDRGR
jgi:hypothetical protein